MLAIPKVSIITVCLNSKQYIEDTIQSVCGQTYKNIEYVIIDGGSTDGSLDIIEKYEKNITYSVSEPDRGIADAFNKGIRASTGEIIGFLNSQDYYINNSVIQKIIDIFIINPEIKILYGKTNIIPETSSDIVAVMGEKFTKELMKKRSIIPHPSVFIKREVFENYGLFQLKYKIAMDYEFLLRVTRYCPPFFIDEVLSIMRLGGMSDTNKYSVCAELFKAQISHNVPFLDSLKTLFYHYLTCTGLKCLRVFNIYSLDHLYKKFGITSKL
jgi:glycosyltransferase involved in cell wall biosynthesis